MTTTIITKNSSTAGAAPLAADLVQGELAVNVTDKALYTENASGAVVKLNAPSIVDNGNATAITIDSSENVGIGTSSPAQRLHLAQAGQPKIEFEDTTNSSKGRITTGGSTGSMTFDADPDNTKAGTVMTFNVDATERARIDSSGNLLVGRTDSNFTTGSGITMLPSQGIAIMKTSTASVGAGLYIQRVSGIGTGNLCEWAYNGSTVGTISTNGSTTTYGTSSDYRLKENIAPMTGALAKVAQLKPVTYTWKASQLNDEGFIAHELQEVCPSAVTGEKDGIETYLDEEGNEQTRPVYQGIDTSFLVATLTAAIQEQQAIIDAQASVLISLTARIEALES